MSKGFMGSDVFGARVGVSIPVRGEIPVRIEMPVNKRHSMGQSRTEGVEVEPAAQTLCGLLQTALMANSTQISGNEWNTFFSAIDRLRPLGKENPKWRAEVYHQMALHCPDDVSKLRSIPGAPVPTDKCVRLVIKKSQRQLIRTIVEPYQTRGWTILEIGVNRSDLRPFPVRPGSEDSSSQESEVWACPPGEEVPKKTYITVQEASDLAKSLLDAIGPVRGAAPGAAACLKDSQADLAVTEKLLDRLTAATETAGAKFIDVTQDEVDAANRIVNCASQLGTPVSPVPAALTIGGPSLETTGQITGIGVESAFVFF